MRRKLSKLAMHMWRQLAVYIGIIVVVGGILWVRLGTLVSGLSTPELMARAAASSGSNIIDNPLYLPHKLIQYLFISLGHNGAFWMRFTSTLFAILILLVFYRILRTWYSIRVAALSTFLLLCSSWFLHYARLGTPDILLGSSIGLLWAGMRLRVNQPRTSTLIFSSAIVINSLYIPGLVWLILPLLIWQRKSIFKEVQKLRPLITVGLIITFMITLAPLVYAFSKDITLIKSWLAIPATIDVSQMFYNAWHIPIWLILKGPTNSVYWLGTIPLLDSFSAVMLVLGIFVSSYYLLLDRVRTIFGMLIIGVLLTILNGPWIMFMIAPIIFVLVASGVALLLQQWFTVFPRNPLARTIGVAMVSGILLVACAYNLQAYFIAWPNNSATEQAFQIEQ